MKRTCREAVPLSCYEALLRVQLESNKSRLVRGVLGVWRLAAGKPSMQCMRMDNLLAVGLNHARGAELARPGRASSIFRAGPGVIELARLVGLAQGRSSWLALGLTLVQKVSHRNHA